MAKRPPNKVTRDLVLFVTGLAGVAYETLIERADRPALLAVFAGMLGLPIYLRRDQKPDEPDDKSNDEPGKGK